MPGYHAGESVQLSHQNLFGTSVNPRLAGEDGAVLWNGNFERDRIKTF